MLDYISDEVEEIVADSDVRETADEIAEQYDEIAVESSTAPGGEGWWDVTVQPGYYYDCVPGEVLVELVDNYDTYGVDVYHRDGSPWG